MAFLEELLDVVGSVGVLTGDDADRYSTDWLGRYTGAPTAVVRPATTAQVSAVVVLCAGHGVTVVPQGGNTGLVGGSVPAADDDRPSIVLSLERLNQVRSVDVDGATLTTDAGVTVEALQTVAAEHGLLFGPDWGARGTAQIGGGIATNAGGLNVLRWGSMRSQILGLEVVLPDGRVWDGMRSLRKDSSGLDLKQLFIGTEGTLGIVTGAVFGLHPLPSRHQTAFVALRDIDALLDVFACARQESGGLVSAFELLPDEAVRRVVAMHDRAQRPLAESYDWYALLRLSGGDDIDDVMATVLDAAASKELIVDAAVAVTADQEANIWFIRDECPAIFTFDEWGNRHKFDLAVPIDRVVEFLGEVNRRLDAVVPDTRTYAFGHVGDGNLHFNIYPGPDCDLDAFDQRSSELVAVVDELTWEFGGTISAEHGIGQTMRGRLEQQKSDVELDLMRTVKAALDPDDRFNPGKLLPS